MYLLLQSDDDNLKIVVCDFDDSGKEEDFDLQDLIEDHFDCVLDSAYDFNQEDFDYYRGVIERDIKRLEKGVQSYRDSLEKLELEERKFHLMDNTRAA